MSNSPLVTISIPVYNGEKYLYQALKSVLEQDYLNLEVIISDNVSDDATQSICEEFLSKDYRFSYHRHSENIGAGRNFNYGLEVAKGELFTWLAHDDYFAPNYISKCVEKLNVNPRAIGCCSEIEFVNEDDSFRSGWSQSYCNIDGLNKNVVERVREITSRVGWYASYSIFRTEILRGVSPFQSRYPDDVLMLIELSIAGEITKVPERLFYYRVTDIEKTTEDYICIWKLDSETASEVRKGSFTYTAKEILNVVCQSNLSIQDKYRIKKDFINTLCYQNRDWLGRILREHNFVTDDLTNDVDIKELLEKEIISTRVSQFFTENPPPLVTKTLVFFPHNPYPIHTGAHRRCLEMIAGLREHGCEITLFSSNLFSDRPWTQESVNFLKSKYDIDTFIYQGTEDDIRHLENCRANGKPDKMNWDYFNPPGLMQSFKQVFRKLKPSLVMVSYSLWGKLVSDRAFDSVVKVLDTIDVFSLTMQMFNILNPYFNHLRINPREVDPKITDEKFFANLNILPEREEYDICNLYDYTIAISLKEADLFEQNTKQTQIIYTPMTVDIPAIVNTHARLPLFVISGNNFNLQGATYFIQKVLPIISQDIPDFKLQVIGDGGKRLEPVPELEILGYVQDLSNLYAQSSFAICPLIGGTGQQVKIVEAMAHGVPVVALKNVGENSAIQHGINGFIANDAQEFAKYTVMLWQDRVLCQQMGQAARQHIKENYSLTTVVNSFQNIIASTKEVSWADSNPQIILDGVFFQLYNTGIARVWRSVLEEWSKTDFTNHLIVLDRMGTAPKVLGINYFQIPAYDYNNTDADREMLQQVCNDLDAELFISTYYTTPIETPSVFIGYDMIPEVLGFDLSIPMWQEKQRGIEHASAYLTISEHTAKDLIKCCPKIDPQTVTPALCGVQPVFKPAEPVQIESFRTQHGITKPYFLLVGAGGGYKNTLLFWQGFVKLANSSDFDIVCTGAAGIDAEEYATYAPGSQVHRLQLDDLTLNLAYAGATALIYPSKYEGFGLPIVEALASGCPVITCHNASIPEVAGTAAIYIDDASIEEMTQALVAVQRAEIREPLIAAGLIQSQKFSWTKMAKTVESVLIDRTLAHLQLNDRNLIIFPDWTADEELLGEELASIFYRLAQHPDACQMALIIDTSSVSDIETANDLISGIAINLMMTEDLDITESLLISLTGQLAPIQWSKLLPKLHGKIQLELENFQVIDLANPHLISEFQLLESWDLTIV